MNEAQKYELESLVEELERYRGKHTELITVLIPSGATLTQTTKQLEDEKGTATNIKSTGTRKNVINALERAIRKLKEIERTPPNGLAVFSGNVTMAGGKESLEVWAIEPPKKLKVKIYRCDQTFVLEPLKEMLETDEVYGLLIIERNEASIGLLDGKHIKLLENMTSGIPGKTRAGGQCLKSDSLVQLASGSILKIIDCKKGNIVKSISLNDLSLNDSKVTDQWDAKKDLVYKIITKNPRIEIESSKDHLFFVSTNKGIIEKTAQEIKITDKLVFPEKIKTNPIQIILDINKYYNSFTISRGGIKLLKKNRLNRKLHQKQIAKKLGITQTAISLIELGKRNINKNILKNLCNLLNINFKIFLKDFCKPYKTKEISLPKTIDKSLAQFIGYFAGDSSLEKGRITFFEQDEQVALTYKEKFDRYYNYKSSYKFREDKNYHQLRFTSRPLVRLINEEFPELKKAIDSTVPDKILRSSNDIIAFFLKGFFDAEGYVNLSRGIGLGINNKIFAQQIQIMFLRFGIIASLQEYDNRKNPYSNNPRFTIDITEKKSMELFKKNIGFSSLVKIDKLNDIINRKTDKSNVRQLMISGSKVRNIIEDYGYNVKKLFPKVSGFFQDKRMISKEIFKKSILNNIPDKKLFKELEKFYNCPVLPIQINKIEKTKKKINMIDISIGDKNFIANGLIVHNSAQRFARIRESAAKEFFKRVAEHMKTHFWDNKKLKGILVGGPIPTKDEFLAQGQLVTKLKEKVIAIKDIGGTGMHGLQELVENCEDVLAEQEITKQRLILDLFFERLAKEPNKVAYGEAEVEDRLNRGAVDKLILSKSLPREKVIMLEKLAKASSTEIHIVTNETAEGVQFDNLGGMGGLLRFEIHD
ncbi:MAG: helix-turn-helix domain-containing protein [Nanoarchaeota archaeon]|nr:helix-turn-helix domain-containing protein [Nanoarchaeota archaeon]